MTLLESPRLKVLVVDDDEDTSALLGLLFERQEWETTFAPDLEHARIALDNGDIDALITDVSLPDGSGLSLLPNPLCASLRAAIVVTGRNAKEDRRQSAQNGFHAYIVKPFDGLALVNLVAGLLAPSVTRLSVRPIEPAPRSPSSWAEET
jgi:DNA-binding response OmpR family regulator